MEVSTLSHLTNSAFVVYLLQYFKSTTWYRRLAAWLPMADNKVHVLMSALGAGGTALGMHGAVEGSTAEGWRLAIVIPPLWLLLHALWDWGQQMALNQLVFALAVQQKPAAPVITAQVTPAVSVTQPLEHVTSVLQKEP